MFVGESPHSMHDVRGDTLTDWYDLIEQPRGNGPDPTHGSASTEQGKQQEPDTREPPNCGTELKAHGRRHPTEERRSRHPPARENAHSHHLTRGETTKDIRPMEAYTSNQGRQFLVTSPSRSQATKDVRVRKTYPKGGKHQRPMACTRLEDPAISGSTTS